MGFHETIPGLDHWLTTPPEPACPICPVCGADCETIYFSEDGAVVGCDECLSSKNAWDCPECFPGKDAK